MSALRIATITVFSLGLLIPCAWAGRWTVDYENSELGFTASWEGIAFDGIFRDWSSRVVFDPSAPHEGRIETEVRLSSVDTRSPDRDEGMGETDWFDFARFPKARFTAQGFERVAPGQFVGDATLRIKGRERSLRFPFSWKEEGEGARLHARITLIRTDFGIGEGEWSSGDLVGLEVPVRVDVRLRR
ncbi:MAG: YceI family protein [Gammaproteobacteria bacterium]